MPDINKFLLFGRYTSNPPVWIIDRVKRLPAETGMNHIKNILAEIKKEFNPNEHIITTTNNFKMSRFITVSDILKKRQRSCGSMSSVAASVLRTLGFPTKLINGKFVKNNPNMKHAWLEVYLDNKWHPLDVMQNGCLLTPYHIKLGEHIDWAELEE